jgi:hypothetical protein
MEAVEADPVVGITFPMVTWEADAPAISATVPKELEAERLRALFVLGRIGSGIAAELELRDKLRALFIGSEPLPCAVRRSPGSRSAF